MGTASGRHGREPSPVGAARSARGALVALAAAGLLQVGCGGDPAPTPESKGDAAVTPAPGGDAGGADAGPWLVDVTDSTGLAFRHRSGTTGRYSPVEIMGSGLALLDFDADGDLDVYLVQGGQLPESPPPEVVGEGDRLFRNLHAESGALRFEDATEDAGMANAAPGYGMGTATGDVDGDGTTDLFVTGVRHLRLWLGTGDGRLEDATTRSGLEAGDDILTSAAFVDVDADGDLDLFAATYFDWDPANEPRCNTLTGDRDYCGPGSFPPTRDRFWTNRGDGRFEERFDLLDGAALAPGLGVLPGDFDGDGRPEIVVANDDTLNHLWRAESDEPLRLVEEGLARGLALSGAGMAEASMGIAIGDVDDDGDEDLVMSHLDQETNTLYRNQGGTFVDASATSGVGPASLRYTGFGIVLADLDLDGGADLVVTNGAVTLKLEQVAQGLPLPLVEPTLLFRRTRSGRFEEETERLAPDLLRPIVGRGLAAGDLDDDGDPDLVVTANEGPALVLESRAGDGRPWIGVDARLENGAVALGAEIELVGSAAIRRVRTAGSYLSSSDPRVVFVPDGDPAEVPRVRVRWPGGTSEVFPVAAGAYTTVTRGTGARP